MTPQPRKTAAASPTAQPVAYWTWVATQTILRHTRDTLASVDLSQPQWWALNHLDAAPDGLTRAEVCALLDAFTDSYGPQDMGHATDGLLHRGLLIADRDGRLRLTDAGRRELAHGRRLMAQVRSRIHDGITDEEYTAAVAVLQRMIRNVDGSATPR